MSGRKVRKDDPSTSDQAAGASGDVESLNRPGERRGAVEAAESGDPQRDTTGADSAEHVSRRGPDDIESV
ncbi:MAG TPA: hypothetical protein VMU59_06745 [Caulobacteraceae bacterium]|nr:hypothetical protein [Caulobacteraceae bacterium]